MRLILLALGTAFGWQHPAVLVLALAAEVTAAVLVFCLVARTLIREGSHGPGGARTVPGQAR